MKTAYEPDNTRSSIVILASLAIIIGVVTALIGLSDKPDVSTIAIAPASEIGITQTSPSVNFDSNDDESLDESDSTASTASSDGAAETGVADLEATETDGTDTLEPEREVIVVPTLEPTATPEVAAAVEPTPAPDSTAAETTGDVLPAPSLPTSSGTVRGTFFTKGDENDGATVAQNVITVSFAEDGSGAFQGVLDITYSDGTHILLNMMGPLEWTATNPQVETVLDGAFTLDAPIDADDITSNDAELIITSLNAGSGSLCTSKCFGFTFTPP